MNIPDIRQYLKRWIEANKPSFESEKEMQELDWLRFAKACVIEGDNILRYEDISEPHYVYILYEYEDSKAPFYVGITKHIDSRIKQHLLDKEFSNYAHIQVTGRKNAILIEEAMISLFSPKDLDFLDDWKRFLTRNRTNDRFLFSEGIIDSLTIKQFSEEYNKENDKTTFYFNHGLNKTDIEHE